VADDDQYAGLRVHFKTHLDGGGSTFGQNFLPFLDQRGMPHQGRVFEWCSGPGFMGFSLLAFGFCDTLCLVDINPLAVLVGNSDSHVLVVQAAQDWHRTHAARPRNVTRDRRVLAQREVRADLVVIFLV